MLSRGTHESHLNVTKGPNFQVANLNRSLTQLGPSEIYHLHEMVVWTCDNQKWEGRVSSVF